MAYASTSSVRPLSEMNTTPLIDVMLVLLIMLIMTIPLTTNSLDVELPRPPKDDALVEPDPVRNLLVVERDGGLRWNDRLVTEPQLAALLAEVRTMRPEPEVQFRPEPNASYERSARVVLIVKQSRVTRFGFLDNEKYRHFDRPR
jgi:biopolymer transport protein ExbD